MTTQGEQITAVFALTALLAAALAYRATHRASASGDGATDDVTERPAAASRRQMVTSPRVPERSTP